MFQATGDPIKLKYLKTQESIDELFSKMTEFSAVTENESKNFRTWQELEENISRLQMVMSTLNDMKEQLLAVNLLVHRFVTDYGDDLNYGHCSLKEEVTQLYQKYDDICEQNGTQLTELENLSIRWKRYDENFQLLKSKLHDALNISSDRNCDNDGLNTKEEICRDLFMGLKKLKCEADSLRQHLRDTSVWETLHKELRMMEKGIKSYKRTISASRRVDYPNSSVEDDPDDHFEDAIQNIDTYDATHNKRLTSPHMPGAKKVSKNAKKKSSRFWRILRVAVPVQLTLVLLFCLACYLEPNCCDRLNNFNFSFSPHLRYLRGPPPV